MNSKYQGLLLLLKLCFLVSFGFLVACSAGPKEYLFQGGTMGTSWSVKLVATESQFDPDLLYAEIQQSLDDVNSKMSNWDEYSDVSLFNKSDESCSMLSSDTAEVVAVSQQLSFVTDGLFDATAGPLIELWGFGTQFTADQIPSTESIQLVLPKIGYQNLRLEGQELCKSQPDLFLNLSATAKGFGVDRVAELLESQDLDRYLVEIGGELRASGLNRSDQYWRVGIQVPVDTPLGALNADSVQQIVHLDNQALATSGDYRNYFMYEDVRYSHIIDPLSGWPVPQDLASVTIVHKSALWADGWATALLALGPDQAIALADENQVAAYLILRTASGFEVRTSSAWGFGS